MSSIEALVAVVRAGLDRLERLARDADHDQPWTVMTDYDGPKIRVNDTLEGVWQREGAGVGGAYRCDDPYDDCGSARACYEAEAHLIAQRADPARVLRDVTARRALLERLLAEQHRMEEDGWYSCSQTGEECYDDSRRDEPCDCGRDARVLAYLELLAQPYADREQP